MNHWRKSQMIINESFEINNTKISESFDKMTCDKRIILYNHMQKVNELFEINYNKINESFEKITCKSK